MQLKIPPAVVTVIAGALMWAINNYWQNGWLEFSGHQWVAGALFVTGSLFGIAGLVQFYRRSTTVNPHAPDNASTLVNDGIYRISRNPMYAGLLMMLLAYSFYLGNLLTLIILPLFMLYMNRYQIIPEEKVMEEKFGDHYRSYKKDVRRWL